MLAPSSSQVDRRWRKTVRQSARTSGSFGSNPCSAAMPWMARKHSRRHRQFGQRRGQAACTAHAPMAVAAALLSQPFWSGTTPRDCLAACKATRSAALGARHPGPPYLVRQPLQQRLGLAADQVEHLQADTAGSLWRLASVGDSGLGPAEGHKIGSGHTVQLGAFCVGSSAALQQARQILPRPPLKLQAQHPLRVGRRRHFDPVQPYESEALVIGRIPHQQNPRPAVTSAPGPGCPA